MRVSAMRTRHASSPGDPTHGPARRGCSGGLEIGWGAGSHSAFLRRANRIRFEGVDLRPFRHPRRPAPPVCRRRGIRQHEVHHVAARGFAMTHPFLTSVPSAWPIATGACRGARHGLQHLLDLEAVHRHRGDAGARRGRLRLDDPVSRHLRGSRSPRPCPARARSRSAPAHPLLGLPRETGHAYWTGPDFTFPPPTPPRARRRGARPSTPPTPISSTRTTAHARGEVAAATRVSPTTRWCRRASSPRSASHSTFTHIARKPWAGGSPRAMGTSHARAPRGRALLSMPGRRPAAGSPPRRPTSPLRELASSDCSARARPRCWPPTRCARCSGSLGRSRLLGLARARVQRLAPPGPYLRWPLRLLSGVPRRVAASSPTSASRRRAPRQRAGRRYRQLAQSAYDLVARPSARPPARGRAAGPGLRARRLCGHLCLRFRRRNGDRRVGGRPGHLRLPDESRCRTLRSFERPARTRSGACERTARSLRRSCSRWEPDGRASRLIRTTTTMRGSSEMSAGALGRSVCRSNRSSLGWSVDQPVPIALDRLVD